MAEYEVMRSNKIAMGYVSALTKPSLLTEEKILQSPRFSSFREVLSACGKLQEIVSQISEVTNRIEQELLIFNAESLFRWRNCKDKQLSVVNGVVHLSYSKSLKDYIEDLNLDIDLEALETIIPHDAFIDVWGKCETRIIVRSDDLVHIEEFLDYSTARFTDWRAEYHNPDDLEFMAEDANDARAALGGTEIGIIADLLYEQIEQSSARIFLRSLLFDE